MSFESNLWFPPSVPNVEDDEFTDSDATLSRWTENYTASVDPIDAFASFTTQDPRREINSLNKPSWYMIQSTESGTFRMHKTFQGREDLELPDGTYWTRIVMPHSGGLATTPNGNPFMVLELLSSSAGEPDGAERIQIINRSTTTLIYQQFFVAENDVTALSEITDDQRNTGMYFDYLAITKSGSDYDGWVGSEGHGNWLHMGHHTYAGGKTINRVSLQSFARSSTVFPGNMTLGFDFFRYIPTGSNGEVILP